MTPLRMLSRVLLPLPLAPMSPMLRPASICQETSCRTGTPAKVLTRFSARMSVMGSSLMYVSCTRQPCKLLVAGRGAPPARECAQGHSAHPLVCQRQTVTGLVCTPYLESCPRTAPLGNAALCTLT